MTTITGQCPLLQYNLAVTLFQNEYRIETTRLAGWDYSSRGWYFVTICTKDKECSLGPVVAGKMSLSPAGLVTEHELSSIAEHHSDVWIDTAIVMPNHIHAIVVIDGLHPHSPAAATVESRPGQPLLSTIVGGYKSAVCRSCHTRGITGFQWQPRFHDHILGSNAAVDAVRDYIRRNPENWQEDPDHPMSRAG